MDLVREYEEEIASSRNDPVIIASPLMTLPQVFIEQASSSKPITHLFDRLAIESHLSKPFTKQHAIAVRIFITTVISASTTSASIISANTASTTSESRRSQHLLLQQ